MLKILIVGLLLAVIASLFSGLFFLLRDESRSRRVLHSLILRVTLSGLLLLIIGFALWHGDLSMNPTP
ncbi:twin transmembrane helix small protein [Marinobacter halodurans]|uniref:Twin transmembrane helix small protein n=1 Tax=Marinobacter halodurans TaxID=2528979 RepID=A0ABY1ZL80_9GAMM|nr:twin transmembrane helix small protein [Marinobacter halodurans]TBW56491.1 twin transmembrane helix small protein [Marinobacter halodurans]